MGTKGDKLTGASSLSAEELQDRLMPLGDIRIRKMFGGYGIFENKAMFALINSEGDVYFKVHREGHNLDRARTQFRLVESILEQEEQMQAIVNRIGE